MKTNGKQSNFELMKITSMILILIWHYIFNTGLLGKTTGIPHFVLIVIWFIAIIHVNSFIIVMGYFQCEKKFRLSRLLSLNNSAWFYKVVALFLFLYLGISVSSVEIMELISPITLFHQYWFLSIYLVLYCLSPFLNQLISKLTKKQYHQIIFVLFIITSILTNITGQKIFDNGTGHSIPTFILLYLIGAYLKKYPIEENYFFKVFTTNAKKIIFIFSFFFIAIFNSLVFHYGEELLTSNHSLIRELGRIITLSQFSFDHPLVIIQSICYFLYFSTKNIKSKWINKMATANFGVYLIHDNVLIRKKLYSQFYAFSFHGGLRQILLRIFLSAMIVYVICIIIETIRIKIFAFFKKRKLAEKLRQKINLYLKSLQIELNW